jgi:CheY-like chemotaxis protein
VTLVVARGACGPSELTLVILDLAMPPLGGLEVAGRLRILRPYPTVILYTLHADFFRSQPLPEGVDLVIAKGEPLVPSVMAMLAASSILGL